MRPIGSSRWSVVQDQQVRIIEQRLSQANALLHSF